MSQMPLSYKAPKFSHKPLNFRRHRITFLTIIMHCQLVIGPALPLLNVCHRSVDYRTAIGKVNSLNV